MIKFLINKLSDDIINRFNVSLLIKRPSCVLKELIENSLDALSSSICIHLEDFGVNLIKVIDNGTGIYKDDLLKIGLQYNTSKISSIANLDCIKSYGFRGESLFFIRSLSKLSVISKPYDQSFAYKLSFLNNETLFNLSLSPGVNGTTVEVRDLFYNNSELKKFSRDFLDEYNDILYVLSCMVLSRFDVRFVLYSNGIEVYNFPVCDNGYSKIKRIESFYPGLKIDNIVDINCTLSDVNFYGFIYFNDVKKKNKKFKFFFVNNRIVKSCIIDTVLQEIFEIINEKISLSYCLYLNLNHIDYSILFSFNKLDISFKNYNFIYKFLFDSILKYIQSNKIIYSNKLLKTNNNFLIKEFNVNNHSKFFCINFNDRNIFKNFNDIMAVLDDTNLFFYLSNKIFFVKLNVIRSRVLINLFSLQYLKYNRLLNKIVLHCELLELSVFSIFLDFKNVLFIYGFIFEIFNDKFLILKSIPILLYNLSVDWYGLFFALKNFFERSVFSSFSSNRFDINIINIYVKYIYEKSKLNKYESSFFYKELVFSINNDSFWFKKNCYEVSLKKK